MVRALVPLQVIKAHRSGVWSLCPCSANRLVSGGGDGLLKSWAVDPQTGRLVLLSEVTTPHTETLIVHRNRHGLLISAGHHGGLSVWEFEPTTGELLSRQRLTLSDDREEHTDRLLETRSGHLLAWISMARAPPGVWTWYEAERAFRFQQFLPIERVSTLLELPSGDLVSGDEAGRIISWRLNESTGSWQAGQELQAHGGPIHALAWTREGTLISAGGGEPVLKIWRMLPEGRPSEPQQILAGHRGRILAIVVSDPEELISTDQGERFMCFGWRHRPEMRVWRKGPEGFHVTQRQMGLLRRSLEGDLILDEQGRSLSLWRRAGETYERLAVLTGGHQGLVLAIEPLPSGGFATGGLDGNLASWSLASLQAGS